MRPGGEGKDCHGGGGGGMEGCIEVGLQNNASH